jgi:Mg2+/Co2+ transporter CorB
MEGPVKKILIVEDNSDSREILGLLTKIGCLAIKAKNSKEASSARKIKTARRIFFIDSRTRVQKKLDKWIPLK